MADPGPLRPADLLFPRRRKAINGNRCAFEGIGCKGDGSATQFDGPLSEKEYTISGLCQVCQDDFFGGGDPDSWYMGGKK